MPHTNGHLNDDSLGKFLVSGLKADKPGAASIVPKPSVTAPRQDQFGGQPTFETQLSYATEADIGAHPRTASHFLCSPDVGTLSNAAGQRSAETYNLPASGDGTGAHLLRETQISPSPGADPFADDHREFETHPLDVVGQGGGTRHRVKPNDRVSRHPSDPDDHIPTATQTASVVGGDERAHLLSESQHKASPLVAELIQAGRLRRRWHKAEKSLILQGKALCRAWTSGDKDAANALFERVRNSQENNPVVAMALAPFLAAIERFASERAAIEKELRKLAKKLAVWASFAEGVKGFGELRLALIVGECGDIGSYRNPSCLWKRMGLAVIDGERQRRKTDPDEALRNGYNAERRAMAYVLGTELIKAQLRAPKDADGKRTDGDTQAIGPYGALYLERRGYELERQITKAWAHNRAARYMVKRLFRDLYAAWRKD